jgi:hypothetical protein
MMLCRLVPIVTTFWVGSLWMTGISASILFDNIADRQLAGNVAGHLFTTVSYIGLASGLFLLTQRFFEYKMASFKHHYCWIVFSTLLLIVVGQYGIQPLLAQLKADALPVDVMSSMNASRFAAWHGVAGFVYLIECLLGIALVLSNQR